MKRGDRGTADCVKSHSIKDGQYYHLSEAKDLRLFTAFRGKPDAKAKAPQDFYAFLQGLVSLYKGPISSKSIFI